MRLLVEIETGGTDLSMHKHEALLGEAFGKYYNWAVKSVTILEPDKRDIDLDWHQKCYQKDKEKKEKLNDLKKAYQIVLEGAQILANKLDIATETLESTCFCVPQKDAGKCDNCEALRKIKEIKYEP